MSTLAPSGEPSTESSGQPSVESSDEPRSQPPDEQRCDVIVLGAGPAGLATALEAAERGLDVVLLE
ncbi:MAG: FAD-binding protein, partial [Ornithinimicrobium sp.]